MNFFSMNTVPTPTTWSFFLEMMTMGKYTWVDLSPWPVFARVGVGWSKPPEGGTGAEVVNLRALKWFNHAG